MVQEENQDTVDSQVRKASQRGGRDDLTHAPVRGEDQKLTVQVSIRRTSDALVEQF